MENNTKRFVNIDQRFEIKNIEYNRFELDYDEDEVIDIDYFIYKFLYNLIEQMKDPNNFYKMEKWEYDSLEKLMFLDSSNDEDFINYVKDIENLNLSEKFVDLLYKVNKKRPYFLVKPKHLVDYIRNDFYFYYMNFMNKEKIHVNINYNTIEYTYLDFSHYLVALDYLKSVRKNATKIYETKSKIKKDIDKGLILVSVLIILELDKPCVVKQLSKLHKKIYKKLK